MFLIRKAVLSAITAVIASVTPAYGQFAHVQVLSAPVFSGPSSQPYPLGYSNAVMHPYQAYQTSGAPVLIDTYPVNMSIPVSSLQQSVLVESYQAAYPWTETLRPLLPSEAISYIGMSQGPPSICSCETIQRPQQTAVAKQVYETVERNRPPVTHKAFNGPTEGGVHRVFLKVEVNSKEQHLPVEIDSSGGIKAVLNDWNK